MMPPEFPSLRLPEAQQGVSRVALGARTVLLRGLARECAPGLVAAIGAIAAVSPFRHMVTPGGWTMSVAMTNCGEVGWITDRTGYRYDAIDPATGRPWPAMPRIFADLAAENLFVGSLSQLVRCRSQPLVELSVVPGRATIGADHC